MYFDKTEEVSYSIEDDYRDESNEILTEICEENPDTDEEPSDVEAEEDIAVGTEEVIWYWDFNFNKLMIFLKNTKWTKTFKSTKYRFLFLTCYKQRKLLLLNLSRVKINALRKFPRNNINANLSNSR